MTDENIQIETEFTPNPKSLKFNANRVIIEKGTFSYSKSAEAEKSILAKKLFQVKGVEGVLIGKDFVTITRGANVGTWAAIIPAVSDTLKDHLLSGEPAVFSEASNQASGSESEVEKRIQQFLDEKIRPALARDGGDVTFESYKDGVVALQLRGACSHCPSATMTLKMGVERLLREAIPEVKEVVQV
ncbi:MAG: NifU family protein [Candidatus Omnitrophica bacterium]|nr:NifU family protein [Candidatus Omnitrophota bacterium]